MHIAIIDCGAGNLHSVRKAFASQLPHDATLHIVNEASALTAATHIVLPGVGAFADCMQGLHSMRGMRAALEEAVLQRRVPFLGICVGMQMLFERGYEHGTHAGLGWFQGTVEKINPADATLKIPHMGWNALHQKPKNQPVFKGIADASFAYFVHSYAAVHAKKDEILATADYGGDIIAMVGRGNILATQFHPEKSQAVGLRLIHNFLTQGG